MKAVTDNCHRRFVLQTRHSCSISQTDFDSQRPSLCCRSTHMNYPPAAVSQQPQPQRTARYRRSSDNPTVTRLFDLNAFSL
ncbi:hypothetical protein QQF64_010571 [Cirrhinus molitorella]|uniref:Uncharacterized protein n=1 Tax=Cirrhinus molitorella TaxID=172907 RepID=A0ABR3LWS2_9TELE